MKKSRGQTVVDFVVLAVLAVGIIILGVYKFGDNIANYFATNNVENKFNSGRTVKHENPQDLVSNVTVTFDGITIVPPVEQIIKQDLAAGTYIQTSGSAGRMLQIGKIMEEYTDQIAQLVTAGPEGDALKAELTALNTALTNTTDGYVYTLDNLADDQILESKLETVKKAASDSLSTTALAIDTALTNYLATILASNPVRHNIVKTMTEDLLKTKKSISYVLDPYLYIQFLEKDKNNTLAQDRELVTKIESEISAMTAAEKANIAGMITVYYGGGYSSSSPTAYNGRQMCATFGGTEVDNPSYPGTDNNQYLCDIPGI